MGLPQTAVLADTLSTGAVVRALKAGRAWLAESSDVHLDFGVAGPSGSGTCGGRITATPSDTVRVWLAGGGVPGCLATLIGPSGPVSFAVADEDGTIMLEERLPTASVPFVRAEVRRPAPSAGSTSEQAGPMIALTNPVFVSTT